MNFIVDPVGPPIIPPTYLVIVDTIVSDGITSPNNGGGTALNIPILVGTSQRKADEEIREGVAAYILSNFGLTIDPDDIYFPNP